MKKITGLFLVCGLAFALTGCGEKTSSGVSSIEVLNKTISITQNEHFTMTSDKSNASIDEKVTVSISNIDVDYEVTGVFYNDIACQEEGGDYTFLMPAKDVVITATSSEIKPILSTNYAAISSHSSLTQVKDQGTVYLNIDFAFHYMTILKSNVVSSNSSVIPDTAISIENTFSSQSNVINGVKLKIDTYNVTKGKTWITANFANGNVSSEKTELVFPITITDSLTLNTYDENLKFNVSGITNPPSKYQVSLSDADHVEGSTNPESVPFSDLTSTSSVISVDFKYVVGHRYYVNLYYVDDGNYIYYSFAETVGTGSTATGFDQYKSYFLSFVNPNSSLTLRAYLSDN